MTTAQKITITALLLAAVGAALYETNQSRKIRFTTKNLQAEAAPLAGEISNLHADLASMTNELTALLEENARLNTNSSVREVLKLRSEATRLRPLQDDVATLEKMLKQSSAGLPEWKTNELADAGRASPIDALQTYIYSSHFDPAKLQNGIVGNDIDPPAEEALQHFIENTNNHPGMTSGNLIVDGYKILSQTWLGRDKVRVEVQILTHSGAGFSALFKMGIAMPFTLRNTDGEWKLVVFNKRNKQGAFSELGFTDGSDPLESQ